MTKIVGSLGVSGVISMVVGVVFGAYVAQSVGDINPSVGGDAVAVPSTFDEVKFVVQAVDSTDDVSLFLDDDLEHVGAERRLKLVGDDGWQLLASSVPGLYDQRVAEGERAQNGELLGLPADTFSETKLAWVGATAWREPAANVEVDGLFVASNRRFGRWFW